MRHLLPLLALLPLSHAQVAINLISSGPLSILDAQFVSSNLDPSCNRGFAHTSFSNPNLLAAAKGLVPSRLRVGGSGADAVTYGLSPGAPECAGIPTPPPPLAPGCTYCTKGCLNASHLEELFAFAQGAGWDVIFGVSFGIQEACAGGSSWVWGESSARVNAANLLEGLRVRGIKPWAFELGNEINNKNVEGVPCNFTARQQADAINLFAAMVADALPGSLIVGPDTGGLDPLEWLEALLPLIEPGVLHAVTHHVYNGLTRSTWASARQLDNSLPEIAWYTNVTRVLAPRSAVWAGENGPEGGGNDGSCGTNAVCGIYASTLWYADDMAQRAKHGFVSYQRQDFFGGAYGLTNSPTAVMGLTAEDTLVLRPDYWVAFHWKRLLGASVLNATSSDPSVRAYAFFGTPASTYAPPECRNTTQLLLLNLDASGTSVVLPATGASSAYAAWTLSAGPAGSFGQQIALNMQVLPTVVDVANGGDPTWLGLVSVAPVRGTAAGGLLLAAQSISFVCYV